MAAIDFSYFNTKLDARAAESIPVGYPTALTADSIWIAASNSASA